MLYCIAYYTLVTSLWATGSAEVQSLSQKVNIPWCSIITLANVDRLSKFFHQLIRRKILDLHTTKIFTTPAICCYTTLWNLKIQKCSWFWDFSSILNKLLTCSWRHFEGLISHLTVVRQTVSRLLTLSDWSLSDDVSNQQMNVVQLNVVASWRFFSPWLASHQLRSF